MRFRHRVLLYVSLAFVVWAGIEWPWATPYSAGVLFGVLLLLVTRMLARFALRPRQQRQARKAKTDAVADVWADRVGAERAILPGSRLTDVHRVEHGVSATIKLPPGALTTDDAVKVLTRVASAYEVPVTALAIEPGRKASEASFLLIEDNPLDRPVLFPGPSLRPDGSYDLGVYVDGQTATARFWRPKYGAVHFLLAGTTGAGKSSLFSIVLANATHSGGLVVPWLIDPQGGQSMPEWVDHVDWAATSTREGIAMLEAAHAVMQWRNSFMARVEWIDDAGDVRKGRSYFEPTPQMPLLSIVIDEAAQLLLDTRAYELVAALTKMGRKCGIQILLATQVPSVDELGGNSTIRDQLAGGMAVVLRTGGATSSRMVFSGMPMEPHKIPAEMPDGSPSAGLGFTVGAGTRAAMMRAFYVPDRMAFELARDAVVAELDPGSYAAAGSQYATRHGRAVAETWMSPEPDPEPTDAAAGTALTAVVDALIAAGGQARTGDLIERTGYSRRSVSGALATLVEDGTVTMVERGVYALRDTEVA